MMRTQSRCLLPFICFDESNMSESDRSPHRNNLHKRKTQVTGVCVFYQICLTPYKTHLYICWFIYHVYNRLFSMNVRFINHIDEGIYLIFAVRPTQQKGHVHVIFNEKESLFLQHSSDTRQLKVPHKIKLHLKDKKTI